MTHSENIPTVSLGGKSSKYGYNFAASSKSISFYIKHFVAEVILNSYRPDSLGAIIIINIPSRSGLPYLHS